MTELWATQRRWPARKDHEPTDSGSPTSGSPKARGGGPWKWGRQGDARGGEDRNKPRGGPGLRPAQQSSQVARPRVYQTNTNSQGWLWGLRQVGKLCQLSDARSRPWRCRDAPGTGGFSVRPREDASCAPVLRGAPGPTANRDTLQSQAPEWGQCDESQTRTRCLGTFGRRRGGRGCEEMVLELSFAGRTMDAGK